MWCLGFLKKSVNFVLPQSPTHAKIHQISCDYEQIGSWIILLTLFCLNLRVWKNMFNFINSQQSYSWLTFVRPAQVLSVLSLCFSLPLICRHLRWTFETSWLGGTKNAVNIHMYRVTAHQDLIGMRYEYGNAWRWWFHEICEGYNLGLLLQGWCPGLCLLQY